MRPSPERWSATLLRGLQVRATLDASTDPIKAKIAAAETMKVHTMLVVGHRDLEAGAVGVRIHGKGNLGAKPRAEILANILRRDQGSAAVAEAQTLTRGHRAVADEKAQLPGDSTTRNPLLLSRSSGRPSKRKAFLIFMWSFVVHEPLRRTRAF
ncbi:MAG: His/Gly/Thr/Pro-type tRNA ligase C-terminal domain-containing protein [Chthoniobacteraceae bacterium]